MRVGSQESGVVAFRVLTKICTEAQSSRLPTPDV
jgi:hypothetical protein